MNIKKNLVNKYFITKSWRVEGKTFYGLLLDKGFVFDSLKKARDYAQKSFSEEDLTICKCTDTLICGNYITTVSAYQILADLQGPLQGASFSRIESNFDRAKVKDIASKLRVVFEDVPLSVKYDIIEEIPKRGSHSKRDILEIIGNYGIDRVEEVIKEYEKDGKTKS